MERDVAPAERLRVAVANHLLPLRDKRDYVRDFLFERHNLPRELRGEVAGLSRRYEGLLERLFRDGVAAGAFRADLECHLAVLAFHGMCNMAAARYRTSVPIPLDATVESFAGILLAGVRRHTD